MTHRPPPTALVYRALHRQGDADTVSSLVAAGDGVSDDSARLAAILNSGPKSFRFADGTFVINAAVTVTVSDIEVDFGTATLLNTSAIAADAVFGALTTTAMFRFTGDRVRVKGGVFRDGLGDGIAIYGVYNGGDIYTSAGYTENHHVSNMIFDNVEGDSVAIIGFHSATIENVHVRDKGAGAAAGHEAEIQFRYGKNAQFVNCSVTNANNGGAFYGAYVDGISASACHADDITNSLSLASADGFFFTNCKNIRTDPGCRAYLTTGGAGIKIDCPTASTPTENVSIVGGQYHVAGTGTNPYAAIAFEGVQGFEIIGAELSNYNQHVISMTDEAGVSRNTHSGLISGCRIVTNYEGGASKAEGDGINWQQLSGGGYVRGAVNIIGNRISGGNIYVLRAGTSATQKSSIVNNSLSTLTDYITTSAGIHADRNSGMLVEGNFVWNEDATVETKRGILINQPVSNVVKGNIVFYNSNSVAGSVGIELTGAFTTSYFEDNRIYRAATPFKGMETIGARTETISADNGDAAATLIAGNFEVEQQWNTPLTADRAVTLSATGAYKGARFRIVRTAAATGAFNLNVGTGPLKALASGTWCDVTYNGSAWMLVASGTL